MPVPARPFYYAAEAARVAHVSPSTIVDWCENGTLRSRKVVGRWRIEPRDLERLLKGEAPARK